ncbi:tetratricopeptide repeat protein, partial [Methylogaea oryzae]
AALDELTQQYETLLHQTDTTHLNDAKRNSALSASRHRARSLLKNQQPDELKKLAMALEEHPAKEEAQPYRLLVDGYLAELNNDPQAALQSYIAIIDLKDQAETILEDTLLRVAQICLERADGDNALFALEGLAQLSPIYHPQYAELLKLTGQPQAAVGVYRDFLERFPTNLFVQLRLARLYLELGANDSAKQLLESVLEKHPDNEAAQRLLAETRQIRWNFSGVP